MVKIMVKTVAVVVMLMMPGVMRAQGANLSGQQDTVRLVAYNGLMSSVFSTTQNVQRFNDTIAKYGYGRIPTTAMGAGLGIIGRFSDDFITFGQVYVNIPLGGSSEQYTSSLWRIGVETTYAYVLLRNNVFRFYPLAGIASNYQILAIQEQRLTTPAQLNPAQFQEPWRITMTSSNLHYYIGLGADVCWENMYNRLYDMGNGLYQLDFRIGLHVAYNFGTTFIVDSPNTRHWSANGASVQGLAAIVPQGLSLKLVFTQDMVKIK